MNHEVQLSDFQRGNLMTLARGLLGLQNAFDMSAYSGDGLEAYQEHPCGSVGCAVGYGPRFGIKAEPEEQWELYADRVFTDSNDDAWIWLFSSDWFYTDNTPQGAAKRILYLLRHGIPDNCEDQINSPTVAAEPWPAPPRDVWQTDHSRTGVVAHGLPDRVAAIRAAGNAIVPQVAAQFIQAYLEAI